MNFQSILSDVTAHDEKAKILPLFALKMKSSNPLRSTYSYRGKKQFISNPFFKLALNSLNSHIFLSIHLTKKKNKELGTRICDVSPKRRNLRNFNFCFNRLFAGTNPPFLLLPPRSFVVGGWKRIFLVGDLRAIKRHPRLASDCHCKNFVSRNNRSFRCSVPASFDGWKLITYLIGRDAHTHTAMGVNNKWNILSKENRGG